MQNSQTAVGDDHMFAKLAENEYCFIDKNVKQLYINFFCSERGV